MSNNSAIAYWANQANDQSTGQADPPGTGLQHPTGWVTRQRWSVTAQQWNGMWRNEYNAARDTSAGQSGTPTAPIAGPRHPTGWVNAQQWSATASQWYSMWQQEWTNARDPQGLAYSYPGQGAYGVLWSQSAQYWRQQADFYWGATRTWGVGETWEAAYNRVNPTSLWQGSLSTAAIGVPYNGYYTGYAHGRCGEYTGSSPNFGSGGNDFRVQLVFAGGIVASSGPGVGFGTSHNMGETDFYAATGAYYMGAGATAYVIVGAQTGTPGGIVTFVPTPQYPH
jgi:hypothetical protein